MAKEFEDILNECIDRLLQGESLEQCLQQYPEQAAELRPLLEVALAAQHASAVEPRLEFKAEARYQMHSLLHAKERRRQPKQIPVLSWLPRWATITLVAVFVFFAAGSGTVAAASGSLPGDTLYAVKLATERVRLAFTFSGAGKAKLEAKFAGKRVEEMARIAERDDTEKVEALLSRLEGHLRHVEKLAAKVGEGESGDEKRVSALRQHLQREAVEDLDILEVAEGASPDQARRVITEAKEKLVQSYLTALDALEGDGAGG
ncbi:MAG: hypothetical protein FJ012_01315 [Chloroflexi bacterium]|nr:hypothetical protein [Chloroflexota bacterium]